MSARRLDRFNRFNNQVVIVTGAAQGIGEGVAMAAAQEGALLVVADRSPLLHDVVAALREAGGNVTAVIADLEHYTGAQAVVQAALDAHGRVDVLINNVGGTIWAKPYQAYEPAQIEAEIRRSLFPTMWCCHAVLDTMIARQQGVIVNVSSIATRSIHRIPYAASKGGINALTASLAMEQAGNGIRVNAVATGGTNAPPRKVPRNPEPLSEKEQVWYQAIVDQTIASSPMKRYGEIAEQVRAILFLASDEASYITGTVLPVGGGDQG
jgi:dihydroxycyclohexadiene carboxylate dehydrogenase